MGLHFPCTGRVCEPGAMAKQGSTGKKARKRARRDAAEAAARTEKTTKSVRQLQRRLEELAHEQRTLQKRVKQLVRRWEAAPPFPPGGGGPGGAGGAGGPGGPPWKRGRPPWAMGIGPVVSLEVPLETDDPTAPLWATVAARLPEEIATVTDDGRVARYRYSAAGSTPQAPRYRRLAEPPGSPGPPPPEPFPG